MNNQQQPQIHQIASSLISQSQSQLSSQLSQSRQPIQSIMQQLQQLSSSIQNNPQYPLKHITQYISLYIQHHNRSQEFFNLMCQHNMLAKLFSGASRPIHILENFNLLLSNTQQISELVYIFSHPLFHNYLMINVQTILQTNSLTNSPNTNSSAILASSQCIDYYIQLVKTLVTKLQAESKQCTLLKLFCNSKYSYYPLLTNCIILAIKKNVKQQLVRVTAQHCILQLIGIMANKKVGEYYFCNIHMMIFFYQIISQTIQDQTTLSANQDTTIKYIIDLLKAINISTSHQTKQKTFLLFFTIFSNLIVFKFMKNPAPALNLLLKLTNSFGQIQEQNYISSKYICPIYFILGKLLFNKYLNNVTLSSIILISQAISQLSQLKDINILKIIKNHYQKNPLNGHQIQLEKPNQRNSYQQQYKKKQYNQIIQQNKFTQNKFKNSMLKINQQLFYKQFQHVIKQIDKYNLDNEQFFRLKQNFHKKNNNNSNNWLFGIGSLFKKINIFDIATGQYMKRLSHISCIKYTNQQPIKFLQQIFSPTAIYIYEYLKIKTKQKYLFGQKTQDTQKIQISFNQNRDEFITGSQFFKVVMNISQLALSQIDLIQSQQTRVYIIQKLQKRYFSKLNHPGQIYFILHFRQYIQHSIFEYICSSSSTKFRTQISPKMVNYVYKLSSALELNLSQMNKNKIKQEMFKLQKELYSIVKQKGFQSFCDYLQSEKQKKMVQESKKSFMQTSIIKFEQKDNFQGTVKKQSSSVKKKRSIFKSFKQSPVKNGDIFGIKQSQTSKIVQSKMLHLQLLRYLIFQSQNTNNSSMKSFEKERLPLYKIFEQRFIKKYSQLINNKSKDRQVLYQIDEIGFNSQVDYECCIRVRINFDQYSVLIQLSHENKLILRCNIKQFSLSQPYIFMESRQSYQLEFGENNTQISINNDSNIMRNSLNSDKVTNNYDNKYKYLLALYPTSNTLGFVNRGSAIQFMNRINQIKFGYRQIKDSSILQYLNRQNQINTYN